MEAAVVLPLFLMAMLTLVSVIDLCRVQVEQQTELAQKVQTLSVYAYAGEAYYEEEYIDLYDTHICRLLVSLIPNYKVKLALRGRVHTWTGRSENECAQDAELVAAEMVYVTDYQSVYHTNAACSYLELSVYAVGRQDLASERNDSGSRYHACEKCCSSASDVSVYYISNNGECYHTSLQCSGLKRNIHLVRKKEVAHLSCCSRCQGGT